MPSKSEKQRTGKKTALGWIGWTAGMIDGEGCIGVAKMKRNTERYIYQVRLTVSNSNLTALKRLQGLWGGAIKPMKGNSSKNWRPTFQWVLSGIAMKKLLQLATPYLIIKSEQVKLAIRLQRRISARKGWSAIHDGKVLLGTMLSDEELVVREKMFQGMKKLNKRGALDAERIKKTAA